jgi:hypothetical protein
LWAAARQRQSPVGSSCQPGTKTIGPPGFRSREVAGSGAILAHTLLYTGPTTDPLNPPPDQRTLALSGAIGGLQTGCATDGKRVYTNGINAIQLETQESLAKRGPPTAGSWPSAWIRKRSTGAVLC